MTRAGWWPSEPSVAKDPLSSPKNFLFKTWRTLGLPDPTPLQYDFIEYLNEGLAWRQVNEEAAGGGEGARKILMAFRGAAKTYVCTTNAVFRLRENPLEEALVVSATDGFASAISTMAFQMVTQFDWLAGDMAPSSIQRQSALAFDVRGARTASKDASFTARGIFGQITGLRATLIIGDDLETPNTSETETKRTNLRHRMSELGGAIIKPGGDILLLGTAQTEQTVYKDYADGKGYQLAIYPIRYPRPSMDPKKDEARHYGNRLAPLLQAKLRENPLLAGTATEPSRFDERDIMRRQTEWGTTEFQRQFLMWMNAGADRLYPLKLKDLIALDIAPPLPGKPSVSIPATLTWSTMREHRVRDMPTDSLPGDGSVHYPLGQDVWLPAEETICAVDPSGEGEDETAWAIVAGLGGRVYLLKQGFSLEGHTEGTLKKIAADCAEWGVQLVRSESNFGQGMFSSLLRPHLNSAGCKADVEDVRASGQTHKERRIVETLEPLITSHRLVVNTGVFREDFPVDYPQVEEAKRRFYRLTYQLTRMTKVRGAVKHDDRVDSLASACGYFHERLQRALDKEHDHSKDRALELEAEKIIAARIKAGQPVLGWLPENNPQGFGRGSPSARTHPHDKENGR